MSFWAGIVVGFLLAWLLIGMALTAWLMWSLKGIASASALSIVLSGCAGNWLVITAASYHRDRERGYNERNLGVRIEHPLGEDVRAIGGAYRNSNDRDTVYAGAQWTPLKAGGFAFGAAAAAATGYEHGRAVLLVAPMLSYETRHWGINLLPLHTEVLGLQFKLRFQ